MPNKLTTEEFIEKASNIHNNKFDYSKVKYVNSYTKIKIICPSHGEIESRPDHHLRSNGCKLCSYEKYSIRKRSNSSKFILKASKVHNNKYDYSKVDYYDNNTKVIIVCPIHGEFEQTPASHLRGSICLKCSLNERTSTKQNFIKKSKKVHKNKYDYSKVNYIKSNIKVSIICRKHGEFKQTPNDHLNGCGCSICNSPKGELKVSEWLDNQNIKYISQKRFKNLLGRDGRKRLAFDFYIPKFNICIEYDGIQHYIPTYFGTRKKKSKEQIKKLELKEFKSIQKRDLKKNEFCKNNNIKLIRIKYDEDINTVLDKHLKS